MATYRYIRTVGSDSEGVCEKKTVFRAKDDESAVKKIGKMDRGSQYGAMDQVLERGSLVTVRRKRFVPRKKVSIS